MKSNLSLTSSEDDLKALEDLAAKHCLDIVQDWATSNVVMWRIGSTVSLPDLCNFFNEAGYNGILITASMPRNPDA